MARVTNVVGIQGPGGMIPREAIIQYATQIPVIRTEVIRELAREGWLEAAGVKPVPWYRRLFGRKPAALPAAG